MRCDRWASTAMCSRKGRRAAHVAASILCSTTSGRSRSKLRTNGPTKSHGRLALAAGTQPLPELELRERLSEGPFGHACLELLTNRECVLVDALHRSALGEPFVHEPVPKTRDVAFDVWPFEAFEIPALVRRSSFRLGSFLWSDNPSPGAVREHFGDRDRSVLRKALRDEEHRSKVAHGDDFALSSNNVDRSRRHYVSFGRVTNIGVRSPIQAPATLNAKYSSACSRSMPRASRISMHLSRSYTITGGCPQRLPTPIMASSKPSAK